MTRREFLSKYSAAVSAVPLVLPIISAACAPTSIPVAPIQQPEPPGPDGRIPVDVSDLTSSNPMKTIQGMSGSDGMPVIVTLVSDGVYKAMSSKCTHQACQVNPTPTNGYIFCSCHLSHFALDGRVLQGPAAQPLLSYDSVYDATNKQLRIKLS